MENGSTFQFQCIKCRYLSLNHDDFVTHGFKSHPTGQQDYYYCCLCNKNVTLRRQSHYKDHFTRGKHRPFVSIQSDQSMDIDEENNSDELGSFDQHDSSESIEDFANHDIHRAEDYPAL